MTGFSVQDYLPRLTPPPESGREEIEGDRLPTPPLRKSIYSDPRDPRKWHVNVIPYNPSWPFQFREIATHLHQLFSTSDPPAPYLSLEHIGSTSVPGLAGKPNIDILVTFASQTVLNSAIEALHWEIPRAPPFAKYTQIPQGGGIAGRESFKIYLPEYHPHYASTPERNLYLIADVVENRAGQMQIRGYRTLRETLRNAENEDLLQEYASFKIKLGQEVLSNGFEYSARKDGIIRKILLRGGWTDEEVDEKEHLSIRNIIFDEEEDDY